MTIPSEFYIHSDKYQELSNEAIDWFIKSLKFPYKSDEWQVCRLKERIINRQAVKHLLEANRILQKCDFTKQNATL